MFAYVHVFNLLTCITYILSSLTYICSGAEVMQ